MLNVPLRAQIAQTANDDLANTNIGGSIAIDIVTNDTAGDNPIDNTTVEIVQNGAFVADFDRSNDHIGWTNLGLNGSSTISKFIRFRTTDTSVVLFDNEFCTYDGGVYIATGFLKA